MQENLAPSVSPSAASAGFAATHTSDVQLRGASPVRAPAEERQQPKGKAVKKKSNGTAMPAAEQLPTENVLTPGKADIKGSICILFQ